MTSDEKTTVDLASAVNNIMSLCTVLIWFVGLEYSIAFDSAFGFVTTHHPLHLYTIHY